MKIIKRFVEFTDEYNLSYDDKVIKILQVRFIKGLRK